MLESDCGICGSTYHTTTLHLEASSSNKKPKRDFLARASIAAMQGMYGSMGLLNEGFARVAVQHALALWEELCKIDGTTK